MVHCSSCGGAVPPGARFCPICGTSQSASDEERRVVTALFADIVGFTALAERLDPEEVKHLIDRTFERLARDIVGFGGVVDKILGDGVVALFGAPIAHEDDAERAVRAALRMQQSMEAMAAEFESTMEIRIGVNTGEVLVGMSTAGGDYTAMGDVMNSASRLESMAEPGQVLVGEATHNATRDAIRFESIGELPAKGRHGAISAWVALNAIRPPGARTRRTTSFVGRDLELQLLYSQARLAIEHRRAQSVTILGEAGIGKSRLVEEAAAMIAGQWQSRVLEARSVPYGEANVWWPIAELIREVFGLEIDTSREEARSVILRGLADQLDPSLSDQFDRFTTALLHILGHETRLRGGDRVFNRAEVMLAVTNLLESEVARRPVAIILSDMHWAAEAVWELVRHVLRELSRTPLLVLMTARDVENPTLLQGRHGSLVLHLGSLDAEAARGLVSQLGVDLPDATIAELVERAGGNPFFLEELAGLIADHVDGDQDAALTKLNTGRIDTLPDTLRGIIAARLDALDPTARIVLEAASVLGRTGSVDGLVRMLQVARGIERPEAAIQALVDADLVSIDGSRYHFRSDMVRDVAYGIQTKTVRAQTHFGIANFLEEASPDGDVRNSVAVAIATHFHAAAEIVNEMNDVEGVDRLVTNTKAIDWLGQAGTRALEAGVPVEAAQWFAKGLSLATDPDARAAFLYGRAKARCELRDIAGTRADLERLEPLAASNPHLSALAGVVQGDIDRKAGDLDRAATHLRAASDRLGSLGDSANQSLALRLLGLTEASRGHDVPARQALEAAGRAASASGDRRAEAWALQSLGTHAFQVGHVAEAGELIESANEIFTEIDDRGGLTFTRGLEAWVAFHSHDWERARELIDDVLPETRRRGDPWAEAVMLQLQGSLQLWSGEARDALETARQASDVAERSEDLDMVVTCKVLEGRALVSRARVAEGAAMLEGAFTLAESNDSRIAQRTAAVVNAASAARIGESERAIRWAARFAPDEGDDRLGDSDLMSALALALLQRGAVEEAAAQLDWIDGQEGPLNTNGLAIGALVAVAQGDAVLARRRAAEVLNGSSTYLDRVMAHAAMATLATRLGDSTARDAAIAAARQEVDATDDLLTPVLLDLAVAECIGQGTRQAESRLRGIGVDPRGWSNVWRTAIGTRAPAVDQPS